MAQMKVVPTYLYLPENRKTGTAKYFSPLIDPIQIQDSYSLLRSEIEPGPDAVKLERATGIDDIVIGEKMLRAEIYAYENLGLLAKPFLFGLATTAMTVDAARATAGRVKKLAGKPAAQVQKIAAFARAATAALNTRKAFTVTTAAVAVGLTFAAVSKIDFSSHSEAPHVATLKTNELPRLVAAKIATAKPNKPTTIAQIIEASEPAAKIIAPKPTTIAQIINADDNGSLPSFVKQPMSMSLPPRDAGSAYTINASLDGLSVADFMAPKTHRAKGNTQPSKPKAALHISRVNWERINTALNQ